MNEISWSDSDSVGVKEVDDQHKKLVTLTNTMFQAIMDDRGFEVLLSVLRELEEYVMYHFDYEEKLMAENGCPQEDLEIHVKEHRELTRQVSSFIDRFEREGGELDIELFDFLRTWMDGHLSRTDKEFKQYFASR